MASKNASTATALSELEVASDDDSRHVDICITLRRRSTGEDLLTVGGRWDRVDRKYVGEALRRHVIFVNESQVDLARALRVWLEKRIRGEDREILHFAGVRRGGGKTHFYTVALAVISVALPGAVVWAVSPTHSRRDEIERILRAQVPRRLGWWIWRGQPDFRYTFLTGSIVRLLSGELPETVKQGGAELVFINEAQDQDRKVFSLGLPAIRNTDERPAGLLCIAANPPQRVRGEWVVELVEKVQAGQIDGKYFDVDPDLNASVEQRALDKIATAVEHIDPQAARADLSGAWLPVGERAYPMWRSLPKVIDGEMRPSLVGDLPDLGYIDVTAQMLEKVGVWRSSGRTYGHVLGADFQGRPHMAAAAAKLFRAPDGKLLYYVRHIFIAKGDEIDLSDEIVESGLYTPDNTVIVGDASGDWQSGRHGKRDLPSFKALQSQRWTVIPPREKLRTESEHPSNPPVDRSLGEMFAVMRDGRILVHPSCEWLIKSLELCPLKRDGARPVIPSKGGYSHITDCVRYLVHRFEPKPTVKSAPPSPGSYRVIDTRPRGPRIL